MSEFYFTQLEEGEKMVFGPFTTTSTTSFSAGGTQVSSRRSERRVGVTNRRVIVESSGKPKATRMYPARRQRPHPGLPIAGCTAAVHPGSYRGGE